MLCFSRGWHFIFFKLTLTFRLVNNSMASNNKTTEVTCAYFLQTKKRYCRMSVKTGRKFCGEHASLEAANQACPTSAATYARTPCPYDPNQ